MARSSPSKYEVSQLSILEPKLTKSPQKPLIKKLDMVKIANLEKSSPERHRKKKKKLHGSEDSHHSGNDTMRDRMNRLAEVLNDTPQQEQSVQDLLKRA